MTTYANYAPVFTPATNWSSGTGTSSIEGYGGPAASADMYIGPNWTPGTAPGSGTSSKSSGASSGASYQPYQIPGVGGTDPSKVYQDKLEQMSTGKFDSSDPSYQFRFEGGQQALERSQASKGLLGSGNAAIELQQYGQGMASQEYGAQFQRMLQGMQGVESTYNSQQERLMQMAGIGISQQQADTNRAGQQATAEYQQGELALGRGANLNQGGGSGYAAPGSSGTDWASYFSGQNTLSASQTAAGVDALGNPSLEAGNMMSSYSGANYA